MLCAPTALKMGVVGPALQAEVISGTSIDQATAGFSCGWACKFPLGLGKCGDLPPALINHAIFSLTQKLFSSKAAD